MTSTRPHSNVRSKPLYIEPLPKKLYLNPKIGTWGGYLNPVPYNKTEKNSAWTIIVYNTMDPTGTKAEFWRLLVIRGRAIDRPEIPGIEGSGCSWCAAPIPAGLSFENAEDGGWLFDITGATEELTINKIMRIVFDRSSETPLDSEMLEKIQTIIEAERE